MSIAERRPAVGITSELQPHQMHLSVGGNGLAEDLQTRAADPSTSTPSLLVARVAGLPYETLCNLVSDLALEQAERTVRLEADLIERRRTLSDALYSAVPTIGDRRTRGIAIELRRALFKGERWRGEDAKRVADSLPTQLASLLRSYLEDETRFQATMLGAAETYAAELQRSRVALSDIVSRNTFQRELQISSPTLYRNVARYLSAVHGKLASRDEHIERGLLRYVTRMAFKPTPVGGYCTILPVERGGAGSLAEIVGNFKERVPYVRLNKGVLGVLLPGLFQEMEFVRELDVELNPTIRLEGTCARFLVNHGKHEYFKRVTLNEATTLIIDRLNEGGIALADLAAALVTEPNAEGSLDEAETFIVGLVKLGLLRFKVGVKAQDENWDLTLRERLRFSTNDHIKNVALTLERWRQDVADFTRGSAGQRDLVLSRMRESLNRLPRAPEEAGTAWAGRLVHEDVTSRAKVRLPRTSTVEGALASLRHLAVQLFPLAQAHDARASMHHYFSKRYARGKDGSKRVSLLQFYEDYYREHYQDHLAYEAGTKVKPPAYDIANPFQLTEIEARKRARTTLATTMLKKLREPAQLATITREEVAQCVRELPSVCIEGTSLSTFAEMAVHGDGTTLCVASRSGFLLGYGKYASRFLYMLGDAALESVRRRNRQLQGNREFADVQHEVSFNANLHPPLVDRDILYLASEGEGSPVELSELVVEEDPTAAERLILRSNKSGNPIVPLDLGFLSLSHRPPLFRLLANFGPVNSVPKFVADAALTIPSGERVTALLHEPRLVYDQTVVLRRRSWTLPSFLFPVRQRSESSWRYFRRVTQWRHESNIPRRVYVRVYDETVVSTSPEQVVSPADSVVAAVEAQPTIRQGKRRRGRQSEAERPQFIDFGSPLLVNWLSKLVPESENHFLKFEEELPEAGGLATHYGTEFVSEYVVQIDFPLTDQ